MENKRNFGNNKGRVCVTGANGFIASWLVKRLLESGYYVSGTVRDPGDYEKNRHLFELEGAKERLNLVRADLREEGSFDDAVMGCDGVFHVASPVHLNPSSMDPKADIINPAIEGTLNVLRSCKKNPMLKKVVLTSSIAAVATRPSAVQGEEIDEESWSSIELCEELKLWYAVSKISAEKAAWDFAKHNNINLITVLPSWVLGPCLSRNLCETASYTLALLKGGSAMFSHDGRLAYVHIDDVARCHVLAYEDDTAEGRYICSSLSLDNAELIAFLTKRYPWLPHIPVPPSSIRGSEAEQKSEFNTSKAQKLGVKFKGIEQMFDDFIQSLKEHGYLL